MIAEVIYKIKQKLTSNSFTELLISFFKIFLHNFVQKHVMTQLQSVAELTL